MNAQQRGPYLSSAKDTNVASRAKVEPRNCLGQPLAAAELKEREAADQQMKMKRSIEDIVLKAKARHGKWPKKAFFSLYQISISTSSFPTELEDEPFIFAAFNFFTKTIASDIYIPAEFAACQFSLKSGKTSIYSSHINPGELFARCRELQCNHLQLPQVISFSDRAATHSNMLRPRTSCHCPRMPWGIRIWADSTATLWTIFVGSTEATWMLMRRNPWWSLPAPSWCPWWSPASSTWLVIARPQVMWSKYTIYSTCSTCSRRRSWIWQICHTTI